MRKKIVAGNWKMNLTKSEALALNKGVDEAISDAKCDVYQFAPAIYLDALNNQSNKVNIGAQNANPNKSGAYTGEISMYQLAELGVKSVLIGHSERRQLFNEADEFLKEKVDAALEADLQIIFCCGETLEERESGDYSDIIVNQLKASLFHLSEADFQKIVVAYEPIWAIGTGKTASPEQANEVHASIRSAIGEKYSTTTADNISILYGGSCNPSNTEALFSQPDIDGGLIGGASLKVDDFLSIIRTFK